MKIILILFFLVFSSISCNKEMKERAQKDTLIFVNSSIEGKIISYSGSVSGNYIEVNNQTKKFHFVYQPDRNVGNLGNNIQLGDSLIKEKGSKFFIIKKKNGKILEYRINQRVLEQ